MRELFLFIRPPRPLWPLIGPSSAFWPPLAFASLAGALRDACHDLEVAIIDAPTLRMGWTTLEREIKRLRPSYVGIGEEAVSCREGLRLAQIAKQAGSTVIAGGCFFGYVAPYALGSGLIDVVVHGEGEQTIAELGTVLRAGHGGLRSVRGISYGDGEEIVFTGQRQLCPDLDTLPMPAYDLLPFERYGERSRSHPAFAAIELSRGCLHACSFCVLWRQMGRTNGNGPAPLLRTKSPERVLEEVRILTRRFGRRYLRWVDPCFNAHPEVPGRVAEMMLREGLRIGQSAWLRTDHMQRDATSGALRNCVEAGLNEVYFGIERTANEDLSALNKGKNNDTEVLHTLRQFYPQVFTVGSFIYGVPGETAESLRDLYRQAHHLPLDEVLFIPLTPLPGTPYWQAESWESDVDGFRAFDFLPALHGNPRLDELTRILHRDLLFCWTRQRASSFFGGLVARNPRRRAMTRHLAVRTLAFLAADTFKHMRGHEEDVALRIPRWYES